MTEIKQEIESSFDQIDHLLISDDCRTIHILLPKDEAYNEGVAIFSSKNGYTAVAIPSFDEPVQLWFLQKEGPRQVIWDVVSTSGNVLSDKPILGDRSSAGAFMKMMYNHCELQPSDVIDLSKVNFREVEDTPVQTIKCVYEENMLFQFTPGPKQNEITILGEDHADTVINIHEIMGLPSFQRIVICEYCGGSGEYINDVDFGPSVKKNTEPVKCTCPNVLLTIEKQ